MGDQIKSNDSDTIDGKSGCDTNGHHDTFDPMAIVNALDKCTADNTELCMDSYLVAYRELNK